MFTYTSDKLQTNKKIGSGRFSSVYPYQKEEADQRWVVKHIKADNDAQLKLQLEGIIQSSNQDHPSILPVRGYYLQENESGAWDAYVKLPKMKYSFKEYKEEYLKKKAVIPKDLVIKYYYNLASALDYLEKKRIPHQNLKSTNVLLDQDMKVYISDIGTTKYASDEERAKAPLDLNGAELYLAPELSVSGKRVKKADLFKADVWSLGIVIAELGLSKPRPVDPTLSSDAKAKLVKEIIADLRKNYGQTVPDLVNASLNVDPAQRPSFADIVKKLAEKYPEVAAKEKNQAVEDMKQGASAFGLFNTGVYLYKKAEDLLGTDKKKGVIERFEEKKEVKVVKAAGSFLAAKAGGFWGSSKKKEEPEQVPTDQSPSGEKAKPVWTEDFRVDTANGTSSIRPINASKVTDQKVEELLKDATLNGRTSLSAILRGASEVTDQALIGLASTITQNSKELKQLSVNFSGCKKITDAGIKEFIAQVSQKLTVGKLEQLTLDFSGCSQLTDESLNQISTNLGKNNKTLSQLSLDFSRCPKITDDGVKKFSSKTAENLKQLQSLELSFYECEKVKSQTLDAAREELSYIPDLVI